MYRVPIKPTCVYKGMFMNSGHVGILLFVWSIHQTHAPQMFV